MCNVNAASVTSLMHSPAVCEEASVSVSRSVTTRCGAGGSLSLKGLPVEGRPVQESLLLPPCRQRTTVGAAVGGVFAADVTQTVAARNRTSAEEEGEERRTVRERGGRR